MGSVFSGFSKILDPGSMLTDSVFGEDSAISKGLNVISDPLDLFGKRAASTQDEIAGIAEQSAADSITAQEEMRRIIQEYLSPYRDAGSNALGDYQALATNGDANTPVSEQYKWQRDMGLRNIKRGLSARGLANSTYGGQQAANFLGGLGQEEASRIYGTNLDAIKMGLGAVNSLGGATANAGANIGSTFNALGANQNAIQQNYGAARNQSFQQGANALQGLAQYLA
jgi:hypothetical protein